MAQKTYSTHRPNLTINHPHKNVLGEIKEGTIRFIGGKFSTDEEDVQKFIEGLSSFKDETIYIESAADLIAAASVKAKALRDVADKAVKQAQEAEAALAALQPKKVVAGKDENPK